MGAGVSPMAEALSNTKEKRNTFLFIEKTATIFQ